MFAQKFQAPYILMHLLVLPMVQMCFSYGRTCHFFQLSNHASQRCQNIVQRFPLCLFRVSGVQGIEQMHGPREDIRKMRRKCLLNYARQISLNLLIPPAFFFLKKSKLLSLLLWQGRPRPSHLRLKLKCLFCFEIHNGKKQ